MADRRERRGLGRGLSALMADIDVASDNNPSDTETQPRPEAFIPIEQIEANPDQPRRTFSAEHLEELATSIAQRGVIQPLILRRHPEKSERFQIVAGERRWRAAQMAQLHEVPAIVRDFDDTEVLEVAIVENIQRADLNPLEEASGYRQLMDRFGHTQEKMATALGKSRSHIANSLRLLNLPDDVQGYVVDGRLSAGHARALVAAENASDLARRIVEKGLSVRETEALTRRSDKPDDTSARVTKSSAKDADTRVLERDLAAALGLKVSIDHRPGSKGGRVTITYRSLEQLDDLSRRLMDS